MSMPSTSSVHQQGYVQTQQGLPSLPRLGDHAFYVIANRPPVPALISVIFGEHGMPRLTLVIVRPGGGDTMTKCEIPHRDHRVPGRPFYILPGEVLP